MPLRNRMKPSLHEQITEMQRKIQVLEGDRTAYYENSQSAMKRNRELIRRLKEDNKQLYRELAGANSGDSNVVQAAFNNRGLEKLSYQNISGKEALLTIDQSVLSKKKGLNALKHITQIHQRRLEKLKMDYQRMKAVDGSEAQSSDAKARKREEDDMKLRALKNSLEKTQFKCKEAESIMAKYQNVKIHLQDEALTYEGQLDSLEAEILKNREELINMQSINSVTQHAIKSAKAELQQQEELLYRERKERERIIASNRKIVEDRKAQAEKLERRAQRAAMQPDELSSEAQQSSSRVAGEEEKVISSFEEAFRCIKEATRVTNTEEIVETLQKLERLKLQNEIVLEQLKEQKDGLNKLFQTRKFSGEAQLSSKQKMQEESEQQLQALQSRCTDSEERLEWLVKTLNVVRAGVDQLTAKLLHIPLTEDIMAEVTPDSEEFVVELMTQCELRLQILCEELRGKDHAAIMKEMEEEEFHAGIEGKLPAYNTRVKLPEDQSQDLNQDEEESEDDEADIISREALKRQSQLLIDLKSKKKIWKKKKGKF